MVGNQLKAERLVATDWPANQIEGSASKKASQLAKALRQRPSGGRRSMRSTATRSSEGVPDTRDSSAEGAGADAIVSRLRLPIEDRGRDLDASPLVFQQRRRSRHRETHRHQSKAKAPAVGARAVMDAPDGPLRRSYSLDQGPEPSPLPSASPGCAGDVILTAEDCARELYRIS